MNMTGNGQRQLMVQVFQERSSSNCLKLCGGKSATVEMAQTGFRSTGLFPVNPEIIEDSAFAPSLTTDQDQIGPPAEFPADQTTTSGSEIDFAPAASIATLPTTGTIGSSSPTPQHVDIASVVKEVIGVPADDTTSAKTLPVPMASTSRATEDQQIPYEGFSVVTHLSASAYI
jgi:hypothetical protein